MANALVTKTSLEWTVVLKDVLMTAHLMEFVILIALNVCVKKVSQVKTVMLNHALIIVEEKIKDIDIKENVFAKMDLQVLLVIIKPVLTHVQIMVNVSKENVNASLVSKVLTVLYPYVLTIVVVKVYVVELLIINALVTKVLPETTVLRKNV
jgi:hypothetical protein